MTDTSMNAPKGALLDAPGAAQNADAPMIVRVWERAMAAEAGRVIVATDSEDIASAVRGAGGEAVMTRADHQSGSDRVFEAVSKLDPDSNFDAIFNVQGDLPTLEPHLVRACIDTLATRGTHISKLAAEITDDEERTSPNVGKGVGSALGLKRPDTLRAMYFTRAAAPHGDGPLYHHIGMYGYRRNALERFISLRPSPLELRERLEQLRALEDGMRIDVAIVDTVPIGVDAPADLEKVRAIYAENQAAGAT